MSEEKKPISNNFFRLMTIIMVVLTAILVFFSLLNKITSMGKKTNISSSSASDKSINVSVKALTPEYFAQELTMNAECVNLNGNVVVTAPVGGTLVENRVRLGDKVSIGDVLGVIDGSDIGISYNEAPVVSKVDGVVVGSNAIVNQKIAPQTSLYTIQPESDFVLRATVSESDANTITVGTSGYFTISGDENVHTCHLRYVSPSVNSTTRTVEIEADVDKNDENYKGLRNGNFVRLRLVKKEYNNVFVLPNDAIRSYMGQSVVYVVDSNNVAHRRTVNVDVKAESQCVISGDLKNGERVVVQGSPSEGASVNVL